MPVALAIKSAPVERVTTQRFPSWCFLSGGNATMLAALTVPALAIQATDSFMVSPHYLSYFNELAGGPRNGYRYLGDSNVDWGQDLPALAAAQWLAVSVTYLL